jgi:hypothetical protein
VQPALGPVALGPAALATGAGHHSVLHVPKAERWYIIYHRRPLGDRDPNHRVSCVDEMHFDDQGFILPIKITNEGVASLPLSGK